MSWVRNWLLGWTAQPTSRIGFPEEDLLATANEGTGYFLASLDQKLKDGRYKIIRKLGKGRSSNTFLVEDVQAS